MINSAEAWMHEHGFLHGPARSMHQRHSTVDVAEPSTTTMNEAQAENAELRTLALNDPPCLQLPFHGKLESF